MKEWPEEYYPPYANGPGYILSYDIAKFIVDDFEQKRLRVSYPLHRYQILSAHVSFCDMVLVLLGHCSYSRWKM